MFFCHIQAEVTKIFKCFFLLLFWIRLDDSMHAGVHICCTSENVCWFYELSKPFSQIIKQKILFFPQCLNFVAVQKGSSKPECLQRNISFFTDFFWRIPTGSINGSQTKRVNLNRHSVICSDHFKGECFESSTHENKRRLLKKNSFDSFEKKNFFLRVKSNQIHCFCQWFTV